LKTSVDYIIIGAGPAGLQLAYHLQQAGHSYLVLERGKGAGTFFKTFPRHRTLISSNKVHTGVSDAETNLRWDWNSLLTDDHSHLFKDYSEAYFPGADTFVRYLADFAKRFKLNIRFGTDIAKIDRDGDFVLTDVKGRTYTCKRLVMASGVTKPYIPRIPGIELIENYVSVDVNPKAFQNQRVLILGKGNSAFETAENLIQSSAIIHIASPNPLKLAWKTHFVGHLRAVNNNFLDTYQLKSQNAVLDCTIEKIRRRNGKLVVSVKYTHAEDEHEDLVYDRVIACTGFRFDASMFAPACRPALTINDRFPDQTAAWESVNVKDLYFAGTITQMRDFKKTNSGFIHGYRYNVRALARLLDSRYHGASLAKETFPATVEEVQKRVLRRLNSSSALWQQFGFLFDVVEVDGEDARYMEELPADYFLESKEWRERRLYTIGLEFGHIEDDPFNVPRFPRADKADKSTFLHPVIRYYEGGEMRNELHLLENLYGEWRDPELHVRPLRELLTEQLRRGQAARSARTPGFGAKRGAGAPQVTR
jgi:thioredoxin reductase